MENKLISNEDLLLVRQSYGRMLAAGGLFPRFYQILTASSPRVAAMFSDTDLDVHYERLEQSLTMSLLFPQENVIAQQTIDRIRISHQKARLNIAPEMYDVWLDSLMKAFREHDPMFRDDLEQLWRKVLAVAISHIKAGYAETAVD